MSKFIDDPEYLTIGKYTFDVSNVSVYRKQIARRAYNEAIKEMQGSKEYDMFLLENIIDTYGLFMIRQDLSILKRRIPLIKAIKSYIKRYMLTIKYIRKSNEKEYELFSEWAYFNITGLKKKDLTQINQIQEMEKMALEEIQKISTNPEQQRILLQTFLQETAGKLNI